jgi:hypothetical protein
VNSPPDECAPPGWSFHLLFGVGVLLIFLITGGAAVAALLCLLIGIIPIGLILLALWNGLDRQACRPSETELWSSRAGRCGSAREIGRACFF